MWPRVLTLLVAALVVGAATTVHAFQVVTLSVYPNSTTCALTNGALAPLKSIAGTVGVCMNSVTSPLLRSVVYECSQVKIYDNPTCAGVPVSVDPIDGCHTRSDLSSFRASCQTSFSQITVKYFTKSDCSGTGTEFLSENGMFTSTLVNTCAVSFTGQGQFVSMLSVVNGAQVSTSSFASGDCSGPTAGTITSELSPKCNVATGFASTTDFKYCTVELNGQQAEEVVGQVDLNTGASNLNKQIVGASVGVLCGFTALLVLVSLTGILG